MNDRAIGLLEQYDIEVLRTRKGRGAILCDTKSGCLIFKEYAGNENRILMQDKVLKQIRQKCNSGRNDHAHQRGRACSKGCRWCTIYTLDLSG